LLSEEQELYHHSIPFASTILSAAATCSITSEIVENPRSRMANNPTSAERLRVLLQRLDLAGQYQRAARARQVGTPQVEAMALEHLVVVGPLTPGALGRRLGLTSGGVTALAARLQRAGYVKRGPHPVDRRMRVLTATAAAETLVARQLEPVLSPTEQVIGWLSDSDAQALLRIVAALVGVKERAAADTPGGPARHPASRYKRDLLM
jgi:DNA-binding MarR family transcriptional regulator